MKEKYTIEFIVDDFEPNKTAKLIKWIAIINFICMVIAAIVVGGATTFGMFIILLLAGFLGSVFIWGAGEIIDILYAHYMTKVNGHYVVKEKTTNIWYYVAIRRLRMGSPFYFMLFWCFIVFLCDFITFYVKKLNKLHVFKCFFEFL